MLTRSVSAENEIAREVAGFISSEVDRANSLITRFLHFARPLELRPELSDLTQTIDRAVTLVEREAPGIAIYKNYAPEIPPFSFDAELMERLVDRSYRARPERAIVFRLEAWDINCRQHITPRYTEAEIAPAVDKLAQRIKELEQEVARLTGEG